MIVPTRLRRASSFCVCLFQCEFDGNFQRDLVAIRIFSLPCDSGSLSCMEEDHLTAWAIRATLSSTSGESRIKNFPSGRNILSISTIRSTRLHLYLHIRQFSLGIVDKTGICVRNREWFYLDLLESGRFISDSIPETWMKSYVRGYVEKGSHLQEPIEKGFDSIELWNTDDSLILNAGNG